MLAVPPFWISYGMRSFWALVVGEKGVVMNILVGRGLLAEPVQVRPQPGGPGPETKAAA